MEHQTKGTLRNQAVITSAGSPRATTPRFVRYAIILLKRVKALSVMERSMTKCQEKNEMKKDETIKAAF